MRLEEKAPSMLKKINDALAEHNLEDFAIAGFHVVHRDSLNNEQVRCCGPDEEPKVFCDKWGHCVTTCVKC